MDDAPRHQEEKEKHDQRIGVRRATVKVELEAKERRDFHALQAVGATGEQACAIGRFEEQ